jgi:hypothetical protein
MAHVKLINNEWKKNVNLEITAEEKAQINDPNLPANELKSLIDSIKERKTEKLSMQEEILVQQIYDDNKIQGATLIDVDIFLPQGNGIINCRVNGRHEQIRF